MPVPPPVRPGTVLASRFQVGPQIGGGANSRVYRAQDGSNGQLVALKIEQVPDVARELLKAEAEVLEALCGSVGIPRMVAFAQAERVAGGSVLAMELLGEDLRTITLRARRFSARATAFLGIQMLAALKGVHERGLVHRDVKPGNFAFGRTPEEQLKVYLIDFGLVRRHLEEDGTARRARSETPFRGTTHYASMAAMLCKDLGRTDDLWSLTFTLLEMCTGSLPWDKFYRRELPPDQKKRAKRRVLDEKRRLVAAVAHANPQAIEVLRPYARFLGYLPTQLHEFMRELLPLRYDSYPNYARLFSLLQSVGTDAECRAAAERELHAARQSIAARAVAKGKVQKQPMGEDPARSGTCIGHGEEEKAKEQERLTAGSELAYSPGAGDKSTGSRSRSASPVCKDAPTERQRGSRSRSASLVRKDAPTETQRGEAQESSRRHSGGQVAPSRADFQQHGPVGNIVPSIRESTGTTADKGDTLAGEVQLNHDHAKLAQVSKTVEEGEIVAPVAEVEKRDTLAGKAEPNHEHTKLAQAVVAETEEMAQIAQAAESLQPTVQQAATAVWPDVGSITCATQQAASPATGTLHVELAKERSIDTGCKESQDGAGKLVDTTNKNDANLETSHQTAGKLGAADQDAKASQAAISVASVCNGPDVKASPIEAYGENAGVTQPDGSQLDLQLALPEEESDHMSLQAQGRQNRRLRDEEVEGCDGRRKQKRPKRENSEVSSHEVVHHSEAPQKSDAEIREAQHKDVSKHAADAPGPCELISDRAASLVGFTSWSGHQCGKSLKLVRAQLTWQDEEPPCKVQQEFHRVGVNHNSNVVVCTLLAFLGSDPAHLTLPHSCVSGSDTE